MTRRRLLRRATRNSELYSFRQFLWFVFHLLATILTCGVWLVILFVWWLINNA